MACLIPSTTGWPWATWPAPVASLYLDPLWFPGELSNALRLKIGL